MAGVFSQESRKLPRHAKSAGVRVSQDSSQVAPPSWQFSQVGRKTIAEENCCRRTLLVLRCWWRGRVRVRVSSAFERSPLHLPLVLLSPGGGSLPLVLPAELPPGRPRPGAGARDRRGRGGSLQQYPPGLGRHRKRWWGLQDDSPGPGRCRPGRWSGRRRCWGWRSSWRCRCLEVVPASRECDGFLH